MSKSSLWGMDKEYNGTELAEFNNSWLFSPVIWGVLLDKHMYDQIITPYGYKKSFMTDSSLFNPLNKIINGLRQLPDRICWELSNQQVFFSKDKDIVSKSIFDFITINNTYDKHSDGKYPLQLEHVIDRFREIADEISNVNENEYPYFIFKNTSCDDNVEFWFNKYNENEDEYVKTSLREVDKHVTEFVFIEKNEIKGFSSNVEYFKNI